MAMQKIVGTSVLVVVLATIGICLFSFAQQIDIRIVGRVTLTLVTVSTFILAFLLLQKWRVGWAIVGLFLTTAWLVLAPLWQASLLSQPIDKIAVTVYVGGAIVGMMSTIGIALGHLSRLKLSAWLLLGVIGSSLILFVSGFIAWDITWLSTVTGQSATQSEASRLIFIPILIGLMLVTSLFACYVVTSFVPETVEEQGYEGLKTSFILQTALFSTLVCPIILAILVVSLWKY